MRLIFGIFIILLSGVAVGIADALVKKAAEAGGLLAAFKTPWMLAAFLLYVTQVAFFVYVFRHGWKLGVVGAIQVVFFSLTVIAIGYFFFHETLSLVQSLGIALAVAGVVLINL